VLPRHVKARNSEVRKREMTLKFYSWTPSLLQGSTSLAVSSVQLGIRDDHVIVQGRNPGPSCGSDSRNPFQKFLKG
jgi:hypothetical protein